MAQSEIIPAVPAQATVVVIGAHAYAALDASFQDIDELIDALRANKATKIDLRTDPDAAMDYDRIGKVIFALARSGLELTVVNGRAPLLDAAR